MKPTLTSINPSSARPIKTPLLLRAIRWGFPKLETIAPALAHRWFTRLFFTPLGGPLPPAERQERQTATSFELPVRGKTVRGYAWGSGPAILLVHGWAGRGTQLLSFIDPLVQAGYSVVAFDAPAHGLSAGKQANLLDFRDTILGIERLRGPFVAVVAHSLGGAATLLSMPHIRTPQKVVLISMPTIGDDILHEYARRVKASPKSVAYLNQWIATNLGQPFSLFSALHTGQYLPKPTKVLLMHDEQDREVAIRHAEAFRQAYPSVRYRQTTGLGHNRILRDKDVVGQVVAFILA